MSERIGEWLLERRLGEGAFGEVWLALHGDGRRAALKLFRSAPSERVRRADVTQVRAVRHPNIPELLDFGAARDGRMYTATRYVEGESLRSRLDRDGPLAPAQVRALGRALAAALAALHAQRLVHRDLKPQNVLLPPEGAGHAQLIDLWLMGELQAETGTTQAGVVVGTPAYMAPEQVSGAGLGPSADIWALGVVLFEAATGQLPFEGDTPFAVMKAILQDRVRSERLPREVRGAVARMLRREAALRPAAAELERELAQPTADAESAAFAPAPGAAPAPAMAGASPVLEAAGPQRSAPRTVAGALAASAVAAGAGLLLWWLLGTAVVIAGAVGAAVAALVVWVTERSRIGRAPAGAARRAAELTNRRAAITRSVALAMDELIATTRNHPRASLLTASMALVIDDYTSTVFRDPKARLDASMKVLDIMLQLERRMHELTEPWYVRHQKPLAFVSAVGSAATLWLGLSREVFGSRGDEQPLIRGCPSAAISGRAALALEATDRTQPLVWSIDGRIVMVGTSFRWPADDGAGLPPGQYVVRAAAQGAAERHAHCVVEVGD